MRDMLAHKRWTRRFVVLALLLLVSFGLTIFIVDPYQHYRRATFYPPLWGNQRYFNPGFIKHYDYDCIIIGSSMVDNFIPSEVGRKLSMKVLLAPPSAGGPYEECVLLNTALRTGRVRAVIWGLDLSEFRRGARKLHYGPGSMPFYLYDDNPFNDYQYLLNIDVLLKDVRNALADNRQGRKADRARDMDSTHFWGDLYTYSREATVTSWHELMREHRAQDLTQNFGLDSMQSSFDCNVMPLIERHPEVKYCLFYPPYSILYWIGRDEDRLGTLLEFKRYVFSRTRGLPNVRVFDFQNVSDITFDLDKYRDYSHYSPDVNKSIIEAISKNQYLVTDGNIDEKISRLEDPVRRFTDSLDAAESDSTGVQRPSGDGRTGRQDGEDLEP
jgi:hypothetical protein